jgi:hypothetical protein
MKSRALGLPLVVLVFASCGTIREWQELQSGPMPIGECYEAIAYIAGSSGFAADTPNCDRGLGVWQSRWRGRQLGLGHPGRYRLRAEIDVERGSAKDGWLVRYVVEQQRVDDLRRSLEPREEDWSADGQDREKEGLFHEMLARRLRARAP